MKENKKQHIISLVQENFLMQLLVCVLLCFFVIIGFLIINRAIGYKISRDYTIVEDIRLVNSIENASIDDESIILSGYAFMLENNSADSSISVFLRNVDTYSEIWLDTEQTDRPDVNSYFDSSNYGFSGFIASGVIDKLDKDDIYEIFINIDYLESNGTLGNKKTRRTVSTERYIQGDKLYYYNLNEFDNPDLNIESDLLKEVFQNGILYYYNKEDAMYIYQYKDKFYWIATKDFDFDQEGATYIIYSFYTSQVNKLPKHRIQHKFDRLSFYFEDYEYKEELTAPYRVAIRDIPNFYPITYMTTGLYDRINDKSVWTKSLHLDNILDKN